MLEELRAQQEIWVNAFGGWVPLGSMSVAELQAMSEKNNGVIRVRQPLDGEPTTVSLEDARWRRLGQKQLEKDDNFLLTLAMRAIAGEQIGDATEARIDRAAPGETFVRQCRERGLGLEAAEALATGHPVTIQYEDTPFGPFPSVTVHERQK